MNAWQRGAQIFTQAEAELRSEIATLREALLTAPPRDIPALRALLAMIDTREALADVLHQVAFDYQLEAMLTVHQHPPDAV